MYRIYLRWNCLFGDGNNTVKSQRTIREPNNQNVKQHKKYTRNIRIVRSKFICKLYAL